MLRPTVCLALLSLALAPGSVYAAPLLTNGDFSASGPGGVPEGWTVPAALAGMAEVVDDDGHSGNASLRFAITQGTPPELVSRRVACEPNTEYVLSAWLKSPDLLPSVQVVGDGNRMVRVDLTDHERWSGKSARFNSGRVTELTVGLLAHGADGPMPAGTAWVDDVQVTPAAEFAPDEGMTAAGYAGPPPGPNLALGKPYTLAPGPNYGYCTEPGDATQVTDGEYSVGYFWTQATTVGWTNAAYADITVDLGEVQPINGCSYNTAAGVAGVSWPTLMMILVSDDGKTWFPGGDLVALASKFGLPPDGQYTTFRFVTDDLKLHGRYFRLMVAGGAYTFVDEVEVYQGPPELLAADLGDMMAEDPQELLVSQRVVSAVRGRLLKDTEALRREAGAEGVSAETKAWAGQEAERLTAAAMATPADLFPPNWRAIHPLTPTHAEIYRARARVKREAAGLEGRALRQQWYGPPWDLIDPMALPPDDSPRSVSLDMMLGEYRSTAFNLTNLTDADITWDVGMAFEELGGKTPDWVTVHQVEWIETQAGIPVPDALPLAQRGAGGGWQVRVPSGMTRQVWFTLHPTDVDPGAYRGLIGASHSASTLEPGPPPMQVALRIHPLRLPEKLSCSLGMWDYSCSLNYDLTAGNVDAAIANMREHFLDTPWNDPGCVPWPQGFDAEGNLTGELDFDRFDGWVADWDGATNYAVFLAVGNSLAGVRLDDPRFPRAVGEWMRAWADHLRELGVDPSQLMLLLVDEPSGQEDLADTITAWADAINAAEPDIVVWEDPTYLEPEKAADTRLFEASDVLCPNLGIFGGGTDAHRQFYEDLRQRGKTLWFYQCSGPAKTHDPYYYHRLQHWYAFKYGAVGSGFWAYGDASGAGTSWNELRVGRASFTPVYLDEDSVTDGKHFEAVREGLEDYELLRMLRDHAEKLAADGKAQRADQARSLLDEVIDEVCGEGYEPGKIPWNVRKDRTRADAARVRILEELTR
ncbi:MAG: hypothetical protein FJX74_13420 [Armatimonadetes bacterium]|nr:hypothetical protein [Armatimonadota bacterium]